MTNGKAEPPRGKNGLEWTVFGLSLIVVLGVLGVLIHAAATWSQDGAHLSVAVGEAARDGDRWRVPVALRNEGGLAAEHVVVEVRAGDERGEIEFERVARGGTVHGFVVLSAAPAAAPRGAVKAYQVP